MSSPRVAWSDVLISACGPVIWGSTYIVTTEMLPPDRPFTAAVLRTVPAGLILLAISRHRPPAGPVHEVERQPLPAIVKAAPGR